MKLARMVALLVQNTLSINVSNKVTQPLKGEVK